MRNIADAESGGIPPPLPGTTFHASAKRVESLPWTGVHAHPGGPYAVSGTTWGAAPVKSKKVPSFPIRISLSAYRLRFRTLYTYSAVSPLVSACTPILTRDSSSRPGSQAGSHGQYCPVYIGVPGLGVLESASRDLRLKSTIVFLPATTWTRSLSS